MPQQELEETFPEPVCPFWMDGKHCWAEEKSHGHVASKACSCGARIKARQE